MKVLMITPYVTITSRPEFSRNKTGFGYMVYDIAKAVAVTEEVDVLCTDSIGNNFKQDNIQFLKRNWRALFISFFYSVSVLLIIGLVQKYKMSKASMVLLFYYWMISGYVRKIIKKGHYDVVHVHGCSFSGAIWDDICKCCGVKVVYTLHGLNSFSDTVKLEPAEKQYEQDFLQEVVIGKHQISVISSGMKKTILKSFNKNESDNIVVINNALSFPNSVWGGGN